MIDVLSLSGTIFPETISLVYITLYFIYFLFIMLLLIVEH